MIQLEVTEQEEGMRLDRWCRKRHPLLPYPLVQKWIRKGAIRIEGKRAKASTPLHAGQKIRMPEQEEPSSSNPLAKQEAYTAKQQEKAKHFLATYLLYEDKHILVFNKPAGLATQGGSKVHYSVDSYMHALWPEHPPKLVHRLDKDTSGVLVVAKTASAATGLTKAFKQRTIEKSYMALTAGVPPQRSMTLTHYLHIRASAGGTEKTVATSEPTTPQAKVAITHMQKINHAGDQAAWVELQPETGRKHQIRAQLAAIGCPVAGDGKYGGKQAFIQELAPQMHLHASHLNLQALWPNMPIHVAPLPAHITQSLAWLGMEHSL